MSEPNGYKFITKQPNHVGLKEIMIVITIIIRIVSELEDVLLVVFFYLLAFTRGDDLYRTVLLLKWLIISVK